MSNALPPEERAAFENTFIYFPGWTDGKPGWMLTTDQAGGFRQLFHFEQFRLAVSKSGKLEGPVEVVCVPPAGWRIATAAELVAAGFAVGGGREPEQYYYGQAGWDRSTWEGVVRLFFVAADWATVEPRAGGAVGAGHPEGDLDGFFNTAARLRDRLPHEYFGGVICARA